MLQDPWMRLIRCNSTTETLFPCDGTDPSTMEDFLRSTDDVSDIARLLDDVTLEVVTLDHEADRRRRCLCILEGAILAGSVTAVRAIFNHPQISSYVDRQGGGPVGPQSSCPALIAVRTDNCEVLRVLVEEQGADPFAYRFGEESSLLQPDDDGGGGGDDERDRGCFGVFHGSVFETACRDGRLRCVRYLLGRLPVAAAADDVRRKVVYYGAVAAVEGDGDAVLGLLLDEGAMDPNAVLDNDIGTVLHVAGQCNSARCVRRLLRLPSSSSSSSADRRKRRTIDVEVVATDRQQTALMKAAEYNSVEVMELLLDGGGADIDRQTAECSTALIIACHFGHLQCVETLLAHGANPHLKNRWGFNALYMGTDTPGILERMLREPVDVNEHCGERQEVPLHLATVIGSVDAIASLLDRGAEINRRTVYNENALWLAVWKDHTDAARVLIQNNVDLDPESNGCQVYIWFYQPIEVALGLCNYDVVRMLFVAGCSWRNRRYFRSESEAGPLADVGLPWVQLRSEAFDFIREDQVRFPWLKEMLTNATELRNICRRTVRSILRIPLRKKVKLLPLPVALQNYLLMNDL